MLEIKNVYCSITDSNLNILKGLSLKIKEGETHVIMGPNGTGKSTLSKVIMGHYQYEVTKGDILLDGESILDLSVDERAKRGLFLCMQDPTVIEGVSNSEFLRTARGSLTGEKVNLYTFIKDMEKAMADVGLDSNMLHRSLNQGFSGGEKKRNEILQMKLLEPKFALLDEIDSGLDVDALRIVSESINNMRNDDLGMVIVSHYDRLYENIRPTHVHILVDGQIVVDGGYELIKKVNEEGFEWVKELGVTFKEEEKKIAPMSLGSCGAKVTRDE